MKYEECIKLLAASQTVKHLPPPTPQQTALQNSFTHAVPYKIKREKWGHITKAVAYHIAKDMAPIVPVESSQICGI